VSAPDGLTYQQWISLPATDPRSPLYIPPNGFYQNNGGQLVPNSQANDGSQPIGQLVSTPAAHQIGSSAYNPPGYNSPTNPISGWVTQIESWLVSHAENVVVVIVGLILIAAGLFAFKSTQTAITTVGRAAKRGAEIAST